MYDSFQRRMLMQLQKRNYPMDIKETYPELRASLEGHTTKQLRIYKHDLYQGLGRWFNKDDVFPVVACINRVLLSRGESVYEGMSLEFKQDVARRI